MKTEGHRTWPGRVPGCSGKHAAHIVLMPCTELSVTGSRSRLVLQYFLQRAWQSAEQCRATPARRTSIRILLRRPVHT